jgi:hypothetical protein
MASSNENLEHNGITTESSAGSTEYLEERKQMMWTPRHGWFDRGRMVSYRESFYRPGNESCDEGTDYSEDRKQMIWRLARNWIEKCQEQHSIISACLPSSDLPYRPKRLIDVGGSVLRLVERSEAIDSREATKYATLSYCWGKTMPESAKTTMSTLVAHQKALDMLQLPRTFRQAVEITRGIRIPYLWIDAICIIQDSRDDWEEEAAAMGLVYSNAVVTIAAAVSEHCDGGCLQILPRLDPPRPVTPDVDDLARLTPDDYFQYRRAKSFFESSEWSQFFLGNPLLSRGWTLQERELSPRIIHFTASQVLWECRQARCSESFPNGDPDERDGLEKAGRCLDLHSRSRANFAEVSTGRALSQPGSIVESITVEQRLLAWRETVEDYSGRSFTKVEDRLPALSGLATEIRMLIDDEYLAGLWRKDLPEALLWRHEPSYYNDHRWSISSVRIPGYHFPTWSWVSIEGPIWWPNFAMVRPDSERMKVSDPSPLCARILECKIIPSGSDRTGNLSSVSIRLQGRMKPIPSKDNKSKTAFRNDLIPYLHATYDRAVDEYVTEKIFLFSITVQERSKESDKRTVAGLALVPTGQKDEFERIGCVDGANLEWWDDATDTMITLV